jgi:ankyrin repeat protein
MNYNICMTMPLNTYQTSLPSSSIMEMDIHAAIQKGELEAIRNILSQERLQINYFNEEGLTPLLAALKAKQTDVALLLIESGADVTFSSRKGSNSLMFATLSNDLKAAQAILEKCPQEALFSRADGATPLHIAAQQGNVEMIELLYSHGADLYVCTNSKITPWNLLLKSGLDNPFNISSKLLNRLFRGGAFSSEDQSFKALIQSGNPSMDDLNALANGIDLQAKDPKGNSWMEILLENCEPTHPESLVLLRLLLEKGANPLSFLPAKWENIFPDLIHSRQKTLCVLLELVDIDNENYILNSFFLLPFAEQLSEEDLFNMLVSDKIKGYLQLIGSFDAVFKKITSIILEKEYSDRLRIGTGILAHASIDFQEKLIRALLKQGMEPFSLFSTNDSRCLLRIYVDLGRENPFDYLSDDYIDLFSRFITFPTETIKSGFDGLRLLEYRWHHCRSTSQETLFKFALQSIGLSSGHFLANMEDPSSVISTSEGGSDLYSYPYTALYAEEFLENMSTTCLSDRDKKEVLKELLSSLNSGHVSGQTDLQQKEVFALIRTGYKEHSFPVLFFTSAYGVMRAAANRGGGGFEKSSLIVHAINQENLSKNTLQNTQEVGNFSKKESREYLYRASLQKLDANGCLPIIKLISEVFRKKPQKRPNCIIVAAKTSFELLMAAKVLQNGEDNIEKHLRDVNTQYKWFTLFTAIHAMNDLYMGSEIIAQIFDLTAERDLRKKIEAKYKKTVKRFGAPPLFIQKQYDLFLSRSEKFNETIPELLRQNYQMKIKNEEAIKQGKIQWIEQCLHDKSLNEKDCYGNNALQIAILNNQIEIAELLCQQSKIDLTSQNYDNESALLIAIRRNHHPTFVEKILKACPQAVHISKKGFFPIDFAFAQGDKDLVGKLIEYGADPQSAFYTLGWRSLRKNREIFKYFFDKNGEDQRLAIFRKLEIKLFDQVLDDLNVQEYRDQNYVNLQKTEKMYIDDLKFLYDLGMRWGDSLEKRAMAAFDLPVNSQSELLAYIRENKKQHSVSK